MKWPEPRRDAIAALAVSISPPAAAGSPAASNIWPSRSRAMSCSSESAPRKSAANSTTPPCASIAASEPSAKRLSASSLSADQTACNSGSKSSNRLAACACAAMASVGATSALAISASSLLSSVRSRKASSYRAAHSAAKTRGTSCDRKTKRPVQMRKCLAVMLPSFAGT